MKFTFFLIAATGGCDVLKREQKAGKVQGYSE
jgi:hypothetical protein